MQASWGTPSTNHCPFRAFLLRSLPRGPAGPARAGPGGQGWANAEQIPLAQGSSLFGGGGPGFCLAYVGLHPGRGLDRPSTFTGLQAEKTQMCL